MSPEFKVAETLEEALLELEAEGALAVGGGTQIGLLARHRLIEPSRLVWLGRVGGLRGCAREPDGGLAIGATTTLAEIAASAAVLSAHPILAEAASRVGNPRVRAVATLGGHLVHADPRQDLPPVLLALGAAVRLRGREGERTVPVRELFVGPFETVVAPGELLTGVVVPARAEAARAAYLRFAPASGTDYPTVAVAAVCELDGGLVRRAVLGLGGVHGRPLLVELPELAGRPPGREAVEAAAAAASAACDPVTDQRGSASYKRAMAALWSGRALSMLL